MDLVSVWAVKIAEEAAPDEVDLAPIMAQAFVSGGKEREEMFRQSAGGVHGAFGADVALALFPLILQGITLAWVPLQWVLTSNIIGNLGAVNDLLSIKDRFRRKKKEEALADGPYASLKQVNAVISGELRASGLPPEQCDLIAYRVLKVLLEDPTGATQFTKKVAEAS